MRETSKGLLRRNTILSVACLALSAFAAQGCQREPQEPAPAPLAPAPGPSDITAQSIAPGPLDIRLLVPEPYIESDKVWVPPTVAFRFQSHDAAHVLTLSGWRGVGPFEVRVFANNTLVANRTFEPGSFEMSVDLPAQPGSETIVRVETPQIGPTERDLRALGWVFHSGELRRQDNPPT